MWCCLTPASRRLFFTSAKLPSSAPLPIELPGRRWLNGPIETSSSTSDASRTLAQTRQSRPIVESMTSLFGPMTVPSPTVVVPPRMTFGSMTTSGASIDRRVDERRADVADRHAGRHVAGIDVEPEIVFCSVELCPVVDPEQRAVVLDLEGRDGPSVDSSEADELGEIQLPGPRRWHDVGDPVAQPRDVERVQPCVDLADRPLVIGRVLELDDALDRAFVVADDAAEARRIAASRPRRGPWRSGPRAAGRPAPRAAPGRGAGRRR